MYPALVPEELVTEFSRSISELIDQGIQGMNCALINSVDLQVIQRIAISSIDEALLFGKSFLLEPSTDSNLDIERYQENHAAVASLGNLLQIQVLHQQCSFRQICLQIVTRVCYYLVYSKIISSV